MGKISQIDEAQLENLLLHFYNRALDTGKTLLFDNLYDSIDCFCFLGLLSHDLDGYAKHLYCVLHNLPNCALE